jgi:uncharacterized protein (TIGR01319 family)
VSSLSVGASRLRALAKGNLKLLIDFGSTFTKLVVVDLDREEVVRRVQAPSTVDRDITIGLKQVLAQAREVIGFEDPAKDSVLACSSAAGGLRMISVGLVPSLSCEAGVRAAMGAGARVVRTFSYELSLLDLVEIETLAPDIILLAGGTDGGNKEVILHNAERLAHLTCAAPVVVAGNKDASDEIAGLFHSSGKRITFAKNVIPEIGRLEVDSCREAIREIFISHIIKAKGIDKAKAIVRDVIMPTPAAVLSAAKLLADGADGEEGWGELVIIDVGGATTDVHSIAKGHPTHAGVINRGLPEPYAKRTVEGDLGVRHNIDSLLEAGGMTGEVDESLWVTIRSRFSSSSKLPEDDLEFKLDGLLASVAVDIAGERHCGKIKLTAGPFGEVMIQEGKDLSQVKRVVGTGGPLVFARDPAKILQKMLYRNDHPHLLKPRSAQLYLDRTYSLYAMGLLAQTEPRKALKIMKKILYPLS